MRESALSSIPERPSELSSKMIKKKQEIKELADRIYQASQRREQAEKTGTEQTSAPTQK